MKMKLTEAEKRKVRVANENWEHVKKRFNMEAFEAELGSSSSRQRIGASQVPDAGSIPADPTK